MADDESRPDGISGRVAELYAETQDARDASLREQVSSMAATYGSTDNLVVGLILNTASIVVGVWGYTVFTGLPAYGFAIFGILGVLGILSGVLRL